MLDTNGLATVFVEGMAVGAMILGLPTAIAWAIGSAFRQSGGSD